MSKTYTFTISDENDALLRSVCTDPASEIKNFITRCINTKKYQDATNAIEEVNDSIIDSQES